VGDIAAFHAQAAASAAVPPPPSIAGEAVGALMGLGTAEVLARRAVEQAIARLGAEAELSAVIKGALQELAR
jgi:Holliday junction DNA helicase RuvA